MICWQLLNIYFCVCENCQIFIFWGEGIQCTNFDFKSYTSYCINLSIALFVYLIKYLYLFGTVYENTSDKILKCLISSSKREVTNLSPTGQCFLLFRLIKSSFYFIYSTVFYQFNMTYLHLPTKKQSNKKHYDLLRNLINCKHYWEPFCRGNTHNNPSGFFLNASFTHLPNNKPNNSCSLHIFFIGWDKIM